MWLVLSSRHGILIIIVLWSVTTPKWCEAISIPVTLFSYYTKFVVGLYAIIIVAGCLVNKGSLCSRKDVNLVEVVFSVEF